MQMNKKVMADGYIHIYINSNSYTYIYTSVVNQIMKWINRQKV